MKKFENTLLVTQDDSAIELIKEMNKFGGDGWEVSGVIHNTVYKNFTVAFKREIES